MMHLVGPHDLVAAIEEGNYLKVIQQLCLEGKTSIEEIEAKEDSLLGTAFLLAFVQIGWTGPPLDIREFDHLNSSAFEYLKVNGEDPYHLMPNAALLAISKHLLTQSHNKLQNLPSAVWLFRATFLQQKLINEHCQDLFDQLQKLAIFIETNADATLILEIGLFYHYYGHDATAKSFFDKAKEASGLEFTMSGMMGKRTKFQDRNISQLVVLAESKHENESATVIPKTLDLNDDTLLEKISFKDEEAASRNNLNVVDQCILLAYCFNVKNTNPDHGLTAQQMYPYVARVLENPNNWMVHSIALLLRTRLEGKKTRTVERSVLQLQALVDQYKCDDSTVKERMSFFFCIEMPALWDMEKELAHKFMSIGVVRSALEIFERLEFWEEAVSCHQMMDRKDKAKELVQKLLKEDEKPLFLCLMGDLEREPQWYDKAWEKSEKRYARAMRSLGGYYYAHEDFKKSVECYRISLKINALNENSWYICGCAAMQVEDWEIAAECFQRVVSLTYDNSEAWNNLSTIYIKQNKKVEALRALSQATRFNFDSWKIWQNYLFVAVDVGEYKEAVFAFRRLVDIRSDYWQSIQAKEIKENWIDFEVLRILINVVTKDTHIEQETGKHVDESLQWILETLTSKITSQVELWKLFSDFWFWRGDYEKVLQGYVKSYRICLADPQVYSLVEPFETCVEALTELVEAYESFGEKKKSNGEFVQADWKYQAKMLTRNLLKRSEDVMEGSCAAFDRLKELCESI